jgi:hypothetical protein
MTCNAGQTLIITYAGGNTKVTAPNVVTNTLYEFTTASRNSDRGNFKSIASQPNLIVNASPFISVQPTPQTITYGSNASFTVETNGISTTTYQWQVNSGSGFTTITDSPTYSGANSSTLVIIKPIVSMSGYQYHCIVSGTCNPSTTSDAATIIVSAHPITLIPDAGQKKVYGDPDPICSYTVSESLQLGDAIKGEFFKEIGRLDSARELEKFEQPVLLVQGTKDQAALPVNAQRFEKAFRNPLSKVHYIDGAGHRFDTIEHEKELLSVTEEWMTEQLLNLVI